MKQNQLFRLWFYTNNNNYNIICIIEGADEDELCKKTSEVMTCIIVEGETIGAVVICSRQSSVKYHMGGRKINTCYQQVIITNNRLIHIKKRISLNLVMRHF